MGDRRRSPPSGAIPRGHSRRHAGCGWYHPDHHFRVTCREPQQGPAHQPARATPGQASRRRRARPLRDGRASATSFPTASDPSKGVARRHAPAHWRALTPPSCPTEAKVSLAPAAPSVPPKSVRYARGSSTKRELQHQSRPPRRSPGADPLGMARFRYFCVAPTSAWGPCSFGCLCEHSYRLAWRNLVNLDHNALRNRSPRPQNRQILPTTPILPTSPISVMPSSPNSALRRNRWRLSLSHQ